MLVIYIYNKLETPMKNNNKSFENKMSAIGTFSVILDDISYFILHSLGFSSKCSSQMHSDKSICEYYLW